MACADKSPSETATVPPFNFRRRWEESAGDPRKRLPLLQCKHGGTSKVSGARLSQWCACQGQMLIWERESEWVEHIYIFTCVCMYMHTHTYMHTSIYVHTHTSVFCNEPNVCLFICLFLLNVAWCCPATGQLRWQKGSVSLVTTLHTCQSSDFTYNPSSRLL